MSTKVDRLGDGNGRQRNLRYEEEPKRGLLAKRRMRLATEVRMRESCGVFSNGLTEDGIRYSSIFAIVDAARSEGYES